MKILDPIRAILGHKYVWDQHRVQSANAPLSLYDSLQYLPSSKHEDIPDAPVFVLSAGWRSGSTLLQRVISSSDSCLMWGEPFGDTGLLESFVEPLRRFNETRPSKSFYINRYDKDDTLENLWIANLYPEIEDLKAGYRAFFDRTFKQSALERGANSWGIKEVRLGAEYAYFFKWLYPNCKIIFLVRNPIDAFSSYSKFKNWYHIRPQKPVFTAAAFAKHWRLIASSFSEHASTVGAHILRYEDLVSEPSALESLQHYLGKEVDATVLNTRLKQHNNTKAGNRLLLGEHLIVKYYSGPVASRFGYHL